MVEKERDGEKGTMCVRDCEGESVRKCVCVYVCACV